MLSVDFEMTSLVQDWVFLMAQGSALSVNTVPVNGFRVYMRNVFDWFEIKVSCSLNWFWLRQLRHPVQKNLLSVTVLWIVSDEDVAEAAPSAVHKLK